MKEQTIFNQVSSLMEKGLSLDEAIGEIEGILRGTLPDSLRCRIREQMNFDNGHHAQEIIERIKGG